MASFLHQLKVLLWKNWLSVLRQPVWSLVLIFWPVVIFIILAITRTKFPSVLQSNCHLAPRNLQSTGLLPFLQNFLCDTDSKCANKSYSPASYETTSRSKLKKRSVDSGGGGGPVFQMSSFNIESDLSRATSTANDSTLTLEMITQKLTVGKAVIQDIIQGDFKNAICLSFNSLLPEVQSNVNSSSLQTSLRYFCNSNMTWSQLAVKALLSQISMGDTDILQTVMNVTTKIQIVQNYTQLWDKLLMLPEWIKNPQSFPINSEIFVNLTGMSKEMTDLQSCFKNILKFQSQIQNASFSVVLSGLLDTPEDQNLSSEAQACISLYQSLPCNNGTFLCWPEVARALEISYWLVTSLNSGNTSSACTFNVSDVVCNNSIDWNHLYQSAQMLYKEASSNSSTNTTALLRILQRAWGTLKQNNVDDLILAKVHQEIVSQYPGDTQVQHVLTEAVLLLFNTTDLLITESSVDLLSLKIDDYLGVLQNLLESVNLLLPDTQQTELKNISEALNLILQSVVQNVQYLNDITHFLTPYNVSDQNRTELQTIIKNVLSINLQNVSSSDSAILQQIISVLNQPAFNSLKQTLQTIFLGDPSYSNLTTALSETLTLFRQVIHLVSMSDSSLLSEYYLKQIADFLISNNTLQNNLRLLNSYFNYTSQLSFLQSDILTSLALDILSIIIPSNLQNISTNTNEKTLALFKLFSNTIPLQEQYIFNNVQNATLTLINELNICQKDHYNCTGSIIIFQQLLAGSIQFLISVENGDVQNEFNNGSLLQLKMFSSTEVSAINNVFMMILCSQEHLNNSCNTPIDIYNETMNEIKLISNISFTNKNIFPNPGHLEELKQNLTSTLQVFESVDMTKLVLLLGNVINASECFNYIALEPLDCTLKLSSSLMDLLQTLPFPQPINDTILVASTIVKLWLKEINSTSDMYQRLTHLYNLTIMAFQNNSTLHNIQTTLSYIVQTVEEIKLKVNFTAQETEKYIGHLLEILKFTNINYTVPTTILFQSHDELSNIKTQLQTVQWYVNYMKNLTETFTTSGDIDPIVTITKLMLSNVLSSMKGSPFLELFANELQYAINLLEKSNIIPALQSILNISLQGGVQSIDQFLNNTMSVLQIMFQQNGTLWNALSNETQPNISFVFNLLKEYNTEQLTSISSALITVDKVLVMLESILSDTPTAINNTYFQIVYNISKEFMSIFYNNEHTGSINRENIYNIYHSLLQDWNSSSLHDLPYLEEKLMDILFLSLQCLSKNTTPAVNQNCSSIDIRHVIQQLLTDSGCQVPLVLSDIENGITFNDIFENVLNSTLKGNMTGCIIEDVIIREELVCLTESLGIAIQFLSRTNYFFDLNITWIQEWNGTMTLISDKLLENNLTCAALDKHTIDNIYQVFEKQLTSLQKIIFFITNQSILNGKDSPLYSEYWIIVSETVKFYCNTQGQNSSNCTIFNIVNDTISHLIDVVRNSTHTDKWLVVSEIWKIMDNFSSKLDSNEQLNELHKVLDNLNGAVSLALNSLKLDVMLPNNSLGTIFDDNLYVGLLNLIRLWNSTLNMTSDETCKSSLQDLLTSNQIMWKEINIPNGLLSNMSIWTCSLISANNSVIDCILKLKAMAVEIMGAQPSSSEYLDVTLKILSALKDFLNVTSMEGFDSFITSHAETFKEQTPSTNWSVYQALHDFVNSLQSIVKEVLSSGTNDTLSTAEKITTDAIGPLNIFLKRLNITGYEDILSFTSEILQFYFRSRNSSLVMDSLAQKMLSQIFPFFQQSGLENLLMQTIQNQILSHDFKIQDNVRILLELLNTVFSPVNGTLSDIVQQTDNHNSSLILNIIKSIVEQLNNTILPENANGDTKDITKLILILVDVIIRDTQHWNDTSLDWVFPQNETSETMSALENLVSRWISLSNGEKEHLFKYSATLVKIFYLLSVPDNEEHVMQNLQYVLNSNYSIINVSILVDTLKNFYDFIHLNITKDMNVLSELYFKQLLNFISDSQINEYLSELSFMISMSQKIQFFQSNNLKNASLEMLHYLYPVNPYNISNNNTNLIPILLNVLSDYIPQKDREGFKNITNTLVSVLETLQNCTMGSQTCVSSVSTFQKVVEIVVHALTSIENNNLTLDFSNSSVLQLEILDKSQISFINNIFFLICHAKAQSLNSSENLSDVYHEVILASKFILNITKDLNFTIDQSQIEIKDFLHKMNIILQVLTTSNMTELLLQMQYILQGSHCQNQTGDQFLWCMFNLKFHLLGVLQRFQVPDPLMERIFTISSITEYWMNEINKTANIYQQIISFYEITKAILQNEVEPHTMLTTITNISKMLKYLQNITSSSISQNIMTIIELLEPNTIFNSPNITLNVNYTQLKNIQAQLEIVQWYITYIVNQTGNHNITYKMYPMYRLTQIILTNVIPTIQSWVTSPNNFQNITEILDMVKLSSQEADALYQVLIELFTSNHSNSGSMNQMETWVQLSNVIKKIISMHSLNTSISTEFIELWQNIDRILSGEWNLSNIDYIMQAVQTIITKENISIESNITKLYGYLMNILNQTEFTSHMNLSQSLNSTLYSFTSLDCPTVAKIVTSIYQMIQKENPSNQWTNNDILSNITMDMCGLLHWNYSQNDWTNLLQTTNRIITAIEPLAPDNTRKYLSAAGNIVSLTAELISEAKASNSAVVTIMKMIPIINELFNVASNTTNWEENATFHKLLYLLLDLAWSSSSPQEVLLSKVQNIILQTIQSAQDTFNAQNESSYNAIFSFSLEVVKLFINRTQNKSNEGSFDMPFLKQVWEAFRQSGLEDMISYNVNQLIVKMYPTSSNYLKSWESLVQLMFNITDLIISETAFSPNYFTTNTTMKILHMVLGNLQENLITYTKNFTEATENSRQTILNVTRLFLAIFAPKEAGQLDMFITNLTTMNLGTDLLNDTANLAKLFSNSNLTHLIQEIYNASQNVFSYDNMQHGKIFLNAFHMFNDFIQLDHASDDQELVAIFKKYLQILPEPENQTQTSLNIILSLLQYLTNLTEQISDESSNAVIHVLPYFQSLELMNIIMDVRNQTYVLFNLIYEFVPPEEQNIFQKVTHTSLQLIEVMQRCSAQPENCTSLIQGFQGFVFDVTQLEAVMQNKSWEGQFANSSMLQFELYDSLQTSLINDIYAILWYAQGHSYNSSETSFKVFQEVLKVRNWILNSTMRNDINLTISPSLQTILDVLTSANIKEFLLQTENILDTSHCINQTDADPLLCSLNLTLKLIRILNLLPFAQPTHDRLSVISSIAGQWLSKINYISNYQQLTDLYNVTILAFQYKPMLYAINKSITDIVQLMQETGKLLNITVNETSATNNLISEILEAIGFDFSIYNISSVLKYNISDRLENIRLQLDVVHWLMLQATNQKGVLSNSLSEHTMQNIAQWMIANCQYINLLIRDTEFVMDSFNQSFSLTELFHMINTTTQNEQLLLLLQQVESVLQELSNVSLLANLFVNETIQNQIWGNVLQLVFNITELIASEATFNPPYINTNTSMKILQMILKNLQERLLPLTENITQVIESWKTFLNVTRILFDISEQNTTSQLNMLITSLGKIPFETGYINNTRKPVELLSVINQLGLITKISNVFQVVFNDDILQQGKVFLNTLDLINGIITFNNNSYNQDIYHIFTKYLLNILGIGNQTQESLNTVLNLLLYFDNLTVHMSSDMNNTVELVLPLFLSPELHNITFDIRSQSTILFNLISEYLSPGEHDILHKVANSSLKLLDLMQNCSAKPETCTSLIQGFQHFMFDITQIQAVILNKSMEEQFANTSLLQLESYDNLQITVINDIIEMLWYVQGRPYNFSENLMAYDEVIKVRNWILNTTIRNDLNLTNPSSLQYILEVITSANITEYFLQIENILATSNCIKQTDADPLLCNLNLLLRITQILNMLPLPQPTNETLSIMSSVAEQWLSKINVTMSTYQQLIDLYNVSMLVFQNKEIVHAINTFVADIVHYIKEMGIVINITLNGTDATGSLLSEILHSPDFDYSTYNVSNVLQYNISNLLESIRLRLEVAHWFMLQVRNQTDVLCSSPGVYTMQYISQWMIDNYQYIKVIIGDTELVIDTLKQSFNLTDILHLFNSTAQKEQFQLLLTRIEEILRKLSNVSLFSEMLVSDNIPKWEQFLQLVFNISDLIITEATLTPPYITTNTYMKIVWIVLFKVQETLLPHKENITQDLEESWKSFLNVTRLLLTISGQKNSSLLDMLITSLNTMNVDTDIFNNTAKLVELLSIINQTGLIAEISNAFQVVFNYENIQQGKLFLNALETFKSLMHLNNMSDIQAISDIFTKYLSSISEAGNQTKETLNVILNLLPYLNNGTEQIASNMSNAFIQVFPFFKSIELKYVSMDVINQTSVLFNLIHECVPPKEQDTFQKVANRILKLIEVIQTCGDKQENCTSPVQVFQRFIFDITQLQSVIQNKSWEGLISNSSLLLLQLESYDNLQTTLINDIFMIFSYAQGHPYNSSETFYEDVLEVRNWILNTTTINDLNLTSSPSLQKILEVLISANITEFLLQIENMLGTSDCVNQTYSDPLLCNLNLTVNLIHLLKILPLSQTTHDRLSIITLVAGQWLSKINVTISNYQQLIDFFNVTVLAFQYKPILHLINTSVVNIVHLLQDTGILVNFTVNGTDATTSLLSAILQATDFDIAHYNLSNVLQYNIRILLENIKFQFDVLHWFMLQVKNHTSMLESTPGTNTMQNIVQWMTDNYQYINLIITDIEFVIDSSNHSLSLPHLLHIMNITSENEQLQILTHLFEVVLQPLSNISFFNNLLMKENSQKDAELALLLSQQITNINMGPALASIENALQILQAIKDVNLGLSYQFNSSHIVEKIHTIVKEGMEILYDIQVKKMIDKEMIYRIYNFTYLLVQDEWNWVPFQNISAMETELLDVWYVAMSPFLGGNVPQGYSGNCSAQDVLHILIQTIFKNTTSNESLEEVQCLWQFVLNSSDNSTRNNLTLNDMISLALQSSPIFHNICSEDSLHPLAEEMACLMQLMELSVGVLADLNRISGLHIPLIQLLNESLTFICDDIPEHNSTIEPGIQLVKVLHHIFFDQSNPLNLFIKFLINHTDFSIQVSNLQLNLEHLSKSIKILATLHGQFDNHTYKLVELVLNVTHLPNYLESVHDITNFLSMNWTIAEVNDSISILETLRRALILIDSGWDATTVQMYQTIFSILKNPNLTFFLNMTNTSLNQLNLTSVTECQAVLNAVARFSDSIWVAFDPTHSKLEEELLSNFSSLVCNLLQFQSAQNSWISYLGIINHILPYTAHFIPVEMTNYLTAAEKIISFLSDILSSPSSYLKNKLGGVFDLLTEELRLFNTTSTIADWMKRLPLRDFYSFLLTFINNDSSTNITAKQITTAEKDVLYLLSKALNATSYTQAFSAVSDLTDYLLNNANNFDSMNNNITLQLLNLMKTFNINVQNVSLPELNGTVINCLKNGVQTITNQSLGHLDEVVQLVHSVSTQINESANASTITDLLKQKITDLQNLTDLICGLGGSDPSQADCYFLCKYHTIVKSAADLAVTGITETMAPASSTTTTDSIISAIGNIWQSFQDELFKSLGSIFPVATFENVSTLFTDLNITITTDSKFEANLGNLFRNRSQVENQLYEIVKINTTSINALMDVKFQGNLTEILEWFVTLVKCHTNVSIVADPYQVFCNLSPEQGYQMTIIFLQNVDVFQLFYRFLVPGEQQATFDQILSALSSLIETWNALFNQLLSEENISNMIFLMDTLLGNSTGQSRSESLRMKRSTKASTPSFTDIAKSACTKNYQGLIKALYLLPTSMRMSSSSGTPKIAKNLNQVYGIPDDNSFCSALFSNLVSTSSGAAYWLLLKPVLYGDILYTPNTPETLKIMTKTNNTMIEFVNIRSNVSDWNSNIANLLKNWTTIQQGQQFIVKIEEMLNNTLVASILKEFLDVNVTDLYIKVNTTSNIISMVIKNLDRIKQFETITKVVSNLMSCVKYNRIQPMNSVQEMQKKAEELQKTNQLFAAVTFDSLTSRKGREVSGMSSLPKQIKYTISMHPLLSEDTSVIRDTYWVPGQHSSMNKYSRGFVYLQENIDRAIIELQTNKSVKDIAVQYQPMPFPCFNKDRFLFSMSFSLPIALMVAWVLFISAFVKKIVHEKELRLHEYMKMMGVNSFSHFFAWFIECAVFLIMTVSILVLILKFGKILPNSNGFILFLFFLDYSLTVVAMSYLISVFFHNTNVAGLSGSLIYIITFFPFIVIATREGTLSFAATTLLSLFSPTGLSYAMQYVVRYEEQEVGIQWHNMYSSPMLDDTSSFGWLCWVLLIDSLIYFIVGGYIRMVFPGKYGIGAVWYFPFLPSFWLDCCGLGALCPRKKSGMMLSNIMAQSGSEKKGSDNSLNPQNEPDPTDLNLGVSLHGLTKTYQSKLAVNNLNLNFYEGHITTLLGHNGAGKTTTLSMLTGLFSATSGTIYVYGEDIRTHLDQARKSMGVCMQYDVLFDYLTTKEHMLLYGSIKAPQWNKRQLHEEVKRTLKDTGLYNHRHKPVKALSGGMRRKLSICIALIGGSKVVILDEPTTGVDPCSRRSIWEVISKNKKDKTIILSTHHLDEAEVLSDRIAFLEQGGLRCCGTPMFLKEKFGSGYHLTLTKKFPNRESSEQCSSETVTALIQSHIPEAYLKEDVGGELMYILPPFTDEISGAYLSLLRALDTSMNDLHIGCYGISDTTIEEVFLKLTDGLDEEDQDGQNWSRTQMAVPINQYDNLMVNDETSSTSYSFTENDDQALTKTEKLSGMTLMFRKCMAIFIKRFHNSRRNWKGLLSQILLPVLFVIAAMGFGTLSTGEVQYPELMLTPNMYGTSRQAVVFGISNRSTAPLMSAMSSFPGIDNSCLEKNTQCLSESSLGSWTSTGNQSLTYGSCNCSTGTTVCNRPDFTPPHRMTYSEQMLYNITGHIMESYLLTTTMQYIQQRYGGWSFGIPLAAIADPLNSIAPLPENMTLSKIWFNNEGPHSLPAFLNSFGNFLLRSNLPKNESADYGIFVSSKPLSGSVTQPAATIALVNTLVALSVLVGYSITTASFVTYVVKEHHSGAKRLQHIAGVGETFYWVTNYIYDLLIYFIPVALSIGMIAAFKLPSFYEYPNLGAVSILFLLFGYATFSWMYLISGTFKNPGMAFITYIGINLFIGINTIISTSVVYLLRAQKSTSDSDYQSIDITYTTLTHVFKIFPQFCFGYGLIQLAQQQAIKDQLAIYGSKSTVDVFSMDILGWMFVALVIQGTFCFVLRLLINDGIIYSVKNFVKRTCMKSYLVIPKNPDEDEDVMAERERVQSGRADSDLLQLQGLTKVFHHVNKQMTAVNNMTLGVPAGECFGLLGVNGAGKTTTFKMLTGDISPSKGNIQVQDQTGNMVNVLGFNKDWSSFGYCPQEDALDELMTGEEHLYFYARIHGIPENKIKAVSFSLLQKLQLMQYKDRITANYSCGTRRKLSTALALVGRPSILLLDEPSSGMDPKTKRHLWKIISEEVKERCAVILTSHSMEECEALCTRLAIMVKGKFQCIGSLQHIKSRFGSGFTVKMHLKDTSVSVSAITDFMHSNFPNTYLKEQHFTMVEYHVPVTAGGVASIFDLLESNKTNLNIIHFSVSQTTLDEVFINFAQAQASPDNSNASSQEFNQVVIT